MLAGSKSTAWSGRRRRAGFRAADALARRAHDKAALRRSHLAERSARSRAAPRRARYVATIRCDRSSAWNSWRPDSDIDEVSRAPVSIRLLGDLHDDVLAATQLLLDRQPRVLRRLLLANVCKQNVTRFPYEIARLAEDIAGGAMVTMASEKDLRHPEIGKLVEKYFKGIASVPTENRCRILRLVENMTLGTAAVGYRTESMHGAGSPQAQRIMISRQGNLEQKKKLAKEIAGIKD